MSEERDDRCEVRIAAHMESREADFGTLFAIAGGEMVECETCDGDGEHAPEYDGEVLDDDQAYTRLGEYPLCLTVKRVLRVDLSTGGPGDWLEVVLDDGEVQSVTYHFNDWFDHAERSVSEDSPLWRAAEYYAEYLPAD